MGCPFFGGALLAIDTTLDGSARRHAASRNGVALVDARRRKELTYPELAGDAGRARLVLAAEVGGRWSDWTLLFLKSIANAKSRSAPGPSRLVPQMECHPVLFGGKGFCVVSHRRETDDRVGR